MEVLFGCAENRSELGGILGRKHSLFRSVAAMRVAIFLDRGRTSKAASERKRLDRSRSQHACSWARSGRGRFIQQSLTESSQRERFLSVATRRPKVGWGP